MQISKEDLRISIGLVSEGQTFGHCSPLTFVERILIFAHDKLIKNGRLLKAKKKVVGINFPKVFLIIKSGWFLIRLVYDIVHCLKMSNASEFKTLSFTEIRHFKSHEFDSPDKKGSGKNMSMEFMKKLSIARSIAGISFKITSGYRTKEHNKIVGGTRNSSHLKGLAADIACTDSRNRYIIVNALMKAGFNRIGIGQTFIHCDIDTDKPAHVVWTY